MNDLFARRVHAAAVAAWWTWLAAVVFLSAAWLFFIRLIPNPPDWLVSLWAGFSTDAIQIVTLWVVGIFKMLLWLWAMAALWLTLWARQLEKR
ncbi:MAG TPA: hypothetical protein VMF30_16725 [Pirellulales bacterium]|nr:hypothetical protein [Pirellulales bacterium]